jgi:hypothetical protein
MIFHIVDSNTALLGALPAHFLKNGWTERMCLDLLASGKEVIALIQSCTEKSMNVVLYLDEINLEVQGGDAEEYKESIGLFAQFEKTEDLLFHKMKF